MLENNNKQSIKIRVVDAINKKNEQTEIQPRSGNKNIKINDNQSASIFMPIANDFSKKKPKKIKKFFFSLLIFLLIIFFAMALGYFIFHDKISQTANAELKLQAPVEISSGQEIEYLIEIKNKDQADMTKVDLLLMYPYGFEYLGSSLAPSNQPADLSDLEVAQNNSFNLPDIKPAEKYTLAVKGRLVGEINEQKNLEAILNFQPANFNSNFQVKKSISSLITKTSLTIDLNYPSAILAEQPFDLIIKLKNNENKSLESVRLMYEYPDGYQINQASTTPPQTEDYWQFESLGPGEEKEININGIFKNSATNNKIFVRTGIMDGSNFKLFSFKKAELPLVKNNTQIKLTINDQETLPAVSWGETLNIKITINNQSDSQAINQAFLKLLLNSELLDKNSLVETEGAVWESDGLVWGEQSKIWENFLVQLKPGKQKELTLSIKIIDQPEDLALFTANDLKLAIQTILNSADLGQDFKITSNKITIMVGSLVQFSAKAFYNLNANVKVGSGPIPPKAEQTTAYKIYWTVNGGNANLKNLSARAILPPGIDWPGNYQLTGGALTFDNDTREIKWSVNELLIGELAQANFYLRLTPDQSQIGQVITLLNPTTFNYLQNEQQETATADNLDTNLIDDPVNNGQGTVQP